MKGIRGMNWGWSFSRCCWYGEGGQSKKGARDKRNKASQLTDPHLQQKIDFFFFDRKQKIELFKQQIETGICYAFPTAFWHRKPHIVQLPYEKDFNERKIPTKPRPIQMNKELLEYCKK